MTDTSGTWDTGATGGSFGQDEAAIPQQAYPGTVPGQATGDQAYPGQAAPGAVPGGGTMSEQLAYQRGQQDAIRRLTTPRMTTWRIICGIVWAVYAVLLFGAAIASFSTGSVGAGFMTLVLSGLAGWYDFRIWTLKARRLMLFIFF